VRPCGCSLGADGGEEAGVPKLPREKNMGRLVIIAVVVSWSVVSGQWSVVARAGGDPGVGI
jgi:hypothetical protein